MNGRLTDRRQVLLSRNGNAGKEDAKVAVTCIREGDPEHRPVTWGELRGDVGRFSQALRAHGVRRGDRVCGVVSNSAEALVLMLATSAVGAIYSCSAADMGTKGILDRMLQIEPSFMFMDDAAVYNGKRTDLRPKMAQVVAGMASVACFRGMVALPRFHQPADVSAIPKWYVGFRFRCWFSWTPVGGYRMAGPPDGSANTRQPNACGIPEQGAVGRPGV